MLRNKMKSKVYRNFVVSYIIVMLIPVIIFGFVMRNSILNTLYENNIVVAENTGKSVAEQYEKMISSVVRIASGLSGNNNFLSYKVKNDLDAIKLINEQLNQLTILNPEFYDIIYYSRGDEKVITKNQSIEFKWFDEGVIKYDDETKKQFLDLLNNAEMLTIIPSKDVIVTGHVDAQMITFVLPLGHINYKYGTIAFIADTSKIRDSLKSIAGPSTENIYLLNNDNEVIMSLNSENHMDIIDFEKETGTYENDDYIINSRKIESYNLKLVSVFSKDQINDEAARANAIIIITILLTCLFGMVVSFLFTENNYSPLMILKSKFGMSDETNDDWQYISNSIDYLNKDNIILQKKMNQFKPYIKNKILSDLISSDGTELHEFVDDDMFEREMYGVCIVAIKKGDKESVRAYIEEFYLMYDTDIFFVETDDDYLTFVVATDIVYKDNVLEGAVKNDVYNIEFISYNGLFFRNISDISKSYCIAIEKLPYKKGGALEYPYESISKIGHFLKENDFKSAEKMSADIIDMLSDGVPVIFVRCISLDILNVFIEYCINFGMNITKTKEIYSNAIAQFRNPKEFSGIKTALKNACQMICDIVINKADERNTIMNNIMEYLEENCYSSDFSVNKMAFEFGMLSSRLSEIFRYSQGKTITDYVWCLRLEKAKNLLETTDMSISDVAASVGYTILNSFTRKFKESTGMSPMEWKNSRK